MKRPNERTRDDVLELRIYLRCFTESVNLCLLDCYRIMKGLLTFFGLFFCN